MPTQHPEMVFAVSDLHMGGSDDAAIFHAKAELAAFVRHVKDTPATADLVVLGDALDYLTIAPFLSFTKQDAEAKTLAILKNNDDVFEALSELVKAPGKRLVWVLGNHDLELLFPGVRALIEARLFGQGVVADRLTWILNAGPLDYPLGKGGTLRFVHGNAGDAWNAVDYDVAKTAAANGGDPAYAYPTGSRLVAEVLNPLKRDGHRHVDLLKPEETVAVPLTLALWPDRTAALLRAAFPLLAATKASSFRKAIRALLPGQQAPTFGPGNAAPKVAPDPLFEALATTLPRGDQGGPDDGDIDLLLALIETGKAPAAPGGAKTFGATDFLGRLLRRGAQLANEEDVLAIDQADALTPMVRETFAQKPEISVLVAGHTHLARSLSLAAGHYFNLGTWADLMRLPRALASPEFSALTQELTSSLDGKPGPAALRPFRRLTYLEAELRTTGGPSAYRVRLCEWQPTPTLSEIP